jgi:hypothetical protein
MSKKKTVTYDIDTFNKLLNVVNTENVGRFAYDLAQYLAFYAGAVAKVRDLHPSETEGLTNTELIRSHFKWIDDGKNDFKGYEVTDPKTGKVTYHKMKGK